MATNLLVDIDQTGEVASPGTWADLSGMTGTPTVQGTGSVCLIICSMTIEDGGTADESFHFRVLVDGSPVGPLPMGCLSDNASEANGCTLIHAVTGLSAATHTFKVQTQADSGSSGTNIDFHRTFQVIEFVDNASIKIDASSAAFDAPGTTYTDIVGMTGTFTPTASSLHLMIFNGTPEGGGANNHADIQFEIGTTLEGPASAGGRNAASEETGTCIMWARTGLAASSTDFAVRWRGIDGSGDTPEFGTGYTRTFQVIEITDDFSLETNVEVSSDQAAPAAYAVMTSMTDSAVNVQDTNSVVLSMAHYILTAAVNETALARLKVDGTLVGPEMETFTDSVDDLIGSQIAYAVDGKSGTIAVELHWKLLSATPHTSTARERTFQVIDFQTAGGAAPPFLPFFPQRDNPLIRM